MSASSFRLTVLPVEILEQIFLRLPGQDIFMVEVVCLQRRSQPRNLVLTSPLCAIGLPAIPQPGSRFTDTSVPT